MSLANKKKLCQNKAFTLLELIITCVIISILVGIAIPQYMEYRLRAETQKAITTLYNFSKAQKEFWFDQTPNVYADHITDLAPDYIDVPEPENDGDWSYQVAASGADTFTLKAFHLDSSGAQDGLELTLEEDGVLTYVGSWPFTIAQAS